MPNETLTIARTDHGWNILRHYDRGEQEKTPEGDYTNPHQVYAARGIGTPLLASEVVMWVEDVLRREQGAAKK